MLSFQIRCGIWANNGGISPVLNLDDHGLVTGAGLQQLTGNNAEPLPLNGFLAACAKKATIPFRITIPAQPGVRNELLVEGAVAELERTLLAWSTINAGTFPIQHEAGAPQAAMASTG